MDFTLETAKIAKPGTAAKHLHNFLFFVILRVLIKKQVYIAMGKKLLLFVSLSLFCLWPALLPASTGFGWKKPFLPLSCAGPENPCIRHYLMDTNLLVLAEDSEEDLLRRVLYGKPESMVRWDLLVYPVWQLDTFLLKRAPLYDTACEDLIRNRMYGSRWGIDPYEPFSQIKNMFSFRNIRDTALLRRRRESYRFQQLKSLEPEIGSIVPQETRPLKRARKPLINPKDSVTRWAFNFSGGVNLAQTSLTHWAAGGESSISGSGKIQMDLAYRRGGHKWETKLNTEYGLLYTRSDGLNKTVDNLLVSSRYGYAIPGGRFFYTAYVEFQTQYGRGYANVGDEEYISNFLAPAYFNTSVGMEYKLGGLLSVYLAPASGRTTIVNDPFLSDRGAFGVDSGQTVNFEIGMTLTTALEWAFWKNMKLKTDANFFTPYDRDFGNVVVDWNLQLEMKVNKVFKATIGTSLKYDDKVSWVDSEGVDHGPKVQFREMITVGIGYTFEYKSKKLEF